MGVKRKKAEERGGREGGGDSDSSWLRGPNDVQAIMSGDGKQNATLQYIQGVS